MKIDAAKIYFVLDYLKQGGEAYYEGRSLVWLDEHTIREDESNRWVIDGLAIKTRKYSFEEWQANDPNAGVTHYIGHDMSFSQFVEWVNNMSPIEFQRIVNELKKMAKKEEEK